MKLVWLLLIAISGCVGSIRSAAQGHDTITVRVIDMKDGKPASKRQVLVYWKNPATGKLDGPPLKGWTDSDGNAKISITQFLDRISGEDKQVIRKTLPETRYVADAYLVNASGDKSCSFPEFSFDEIINIGVVGDNRCDVKFDTTKYKASPGEVILFVGRYRWWEGQH
jgi:hypothetical protein